MPVTINPQELNGSWVQGYAMDLHTLSSEFLGYDDCGHPHFDTQYSEMGSLLYKLKYQQNYSVVNEIVAPIIDFIMSVYNDIPFDMVVPIPPSTPRNVQPVDLLAQALASGLGISCQNCIVSLNSEPVKNIVDPAERLNAVQNKYQLGQNANVNGKCILLLDDLFRSGTTMDVITNILLNQGKASSVYAFAVTKTRIHR